MRSSAVAGVDGWLEQAENVLQDQQERSLSPSLTPTWEAGEVERIVSMTEFAENLVGILRILCERPGRWILVAECGPYRYWQALAFEDGSLATEVISNHWIESEHRWTPEQEDELRELGWMVPDPPCRPNWWRAESTTSPDVEAVAEQSLATLKDAFCATEEDVLVVKIFSSPHRGNTPATPEYSAEPLCSD